MKDPKTKAEILLRCLSVMSREVERLQESHEEALVILEKLSPEEMHASQYYLVNNVAEFIKQCDFQPEKNNVAVAKMYASTLVDELQKSSEKH